MAHATKNEMLRMLPQVEEVLNHPKVLKLEEGFSHPLVAAFVRRAIEDARQAVLAGSAEDDGFQAEAARRLSLESIVSQTCRQVYALQEPSLRRVVNVSGVVIHTNLGRSVLPDVAVEAVREAASGYSTLEYDTAKKARGSRHDHYEKLVCALTGAEAALAVNNNAAAVLMVLSEFASGYEAVVSRGELVEIGGSFRIPDIMGLSQAKMVEVGTTNRTHLSDYQEAVTDRTALLLKVHPSNYRMVGFTESVGVASLRAVADACNSQREADWAAGAGAGSITDRGAGPLKPSPRLLVYEDQGSGAFIHLDSLGDHGEPTVAESLQAGCDLVSFSGDKLLGGPQAGIIVGSRGCIERLKKNPLARVLRLDKMSIAALESTLRLYLDKERALREVPTLRMLSMPAEEVRGLALRLQQALESALPKSLVQFSVVEEVARAGGGALPMCDIPSYAVKIGFTQGDAQSCSDYLISQRTTPIIARVKEDALLCDPRTILDEGEMDEIAAALKGYFEDLGSHKGQEGNGPAGPAGSLCPKDAGGHRQQGRTRS